ncbi:hypothetical protein FA95DRAFT_464512 [Auriscalpium vulgare]|uniref:Uncharacterized protein n=1 Tax=Auriscalpium vulgare TaxID=40419 RepID=A0ACB8SBM8_9AGAM|nr:hypothetical protein FA95DRAFT_464512 [Auriscalpium vulgare]
MQAQPFRVIVRLPYNRPEEGGDDPTPVEWNTQKENHLWDVIARSRAADKGKALAARLEVPLPYLLYRAQTRYEQDLRGLQDIRGALNPQSTSTVIPEGDEAADRPSMLRRNSNRVKSATKLSSSIRLTTPLGVRARLNSLGANSPARMNRPSSSSVLTLRGHRKESSAFRPTSPLSSESESDEDADKADEEDRRLEEQEVLDQKLKTLQLQMTGDALGLVSSVREVRKGKGARRYGSASPPPRLNIRQRAQSSTLSRSQSISSTSSPHGSIPSMPSPPPGSHSPMSRHISPPGNASPPAVSPGNARAQPSMRYRGLAMTPGSNQGSSASSFSDLSEASLSGSALESALLSNIRGGGSRISNFARSHLTGRSGGVRQ